MTGAGTAPDCGAGVVEGTEGVLVTGNEAGFTDAAAEAGLGWRSVETHKMVVPSLPYRLQSPFLGSCTTRQFGHLAIFCLKVLASTSYVPS